MQPRILSQQMEQKPIFLPSTGETRPLSAGRNRRWQVFSPLLCNSLRMALRAQKTCHRRSFTCVAVFQMRTPFRQVFSVRRQAGRLNFRHKLEKG